MILLHTILQNYYKHFNYLESLPFSCNEKYKHKNFNHFHKKKLILSFISNLDICSNKPSDTLLNSNFNYKFVSRSFWNKIINQYWKETIFISNSNSFSETYINKLKSSGLSVYNGRDYKNFLIAFSKALFNGQVQVLMNKDIDSYNNSVLYMNSNNNKYIKYVWKKGLNWHISCLYFHYISLKNKLLNDNLVFQSNKIKANSLPIFAITNDYNQLIMAESSDQVSHNKNQNLFHSLHQFNGFFLSKRNNEKKIYTGLLFINPEDAFEYKEYIKSKNINSSRDHSLKFFIGQINLYRYLLNYSKNQSEFRLVPDLKEVSNLVNLYQYYKNINFDENQKYGKNHFQGQPIYIIKPFIIKNINTNKKSFINYSYNLKENHLSAEYEAIFLNYNTAICAWNKFKSNHSYYKLPNKPLIYVSNLENFLKKYQQNYKKNQFIFIPSSKTYHFVKDETMKKKYQQKYYWQYFFSGKNVYIKTVLKRFIWSLTSRQPTNW
uniref:Ycf80 n=1 Tax=Thuretia quercifolia TaxID=189650 RepID=A0A1Z1MKQ8_9FLOR|nr:hypothetical protein [Thuretia quercifolia]ARW66385.1 hypothetical protein [Thuretia quercifolia]